MMTAAIMPTRCNSMIPTKHSIINRRYPQMVPPVTQSSRRLYPVRTFTPLYSSVYGTPVINMHLLEKITASNPTVLVV
jgi:hypothetical protein